MSLILDHDFFCFPTGAVQTGVCPFFADLRREVRRTSYFDLYSNHPLLASGLLYTVRRTTFTATRQMSKPFDYSKWDHIELSDDEDDVHPNIDRESWFRMKHRSRVEREEAEEKDKKRILEEVRCTCVFVNEFVIFRIPVLTFS